MEELYRRPDLLVRAVRPFASDICFVTFDSYSDLGTLDRPGFGESFFQSREVDAIHLLSRGNDWYLYDYSAEAFEAARQATQGYRRVVAYGSSMGGYAAIRFGRRVGAQVAIAMSPQYSINPAVDPFETRWLFDSEAIDFSIEQAFEHDFVETAYIFYDPRDGDRKHVDRFRAKTQVVPVPVSNGGHPCTTLLGETGLLQAVVLEIAEDRFDPAAFPARLRACRKGSAQLYYNMSWNVRTPARAVHLARIATEIRPSSVQFMGHLGALLMKAGALDEARDVLEQTVALDPAHLNTLYRMSEFHEAAGHLDEAIAIMDRLIAAYPQSRLLAPRLQQLVELKVERAYATLFDQGGALAVAMQRGAK